MHEHTDKTPSRTGNRWYSAAGRVSEGSQHVPSVCCTLQQGSATNRVDDGGEEQPGNRGMFVPRIDVGSVILASADRHRRNGLALGSTRSVSCRSNKPALSAPSRRTRLPQLQAHAPTLDLCPRRGRPFRPCRVPSSSGAKAYPVTAGHTPSAGLGIDR